MCLFGGSKKSADPVEETPAPREPDPERQAANVQKNEARRRAIAYNRKKTTLTSPTGVSNYGHYSHGVTLLGGAL
ncbi:hypothetical protein [uncultured Roseibium sp.]|uniref:hypothetical protein n=1 Tax=uncultured Roseibium sp. TaxID=1936171 RepID=UPI003217ACFF